MPSISVSKDSKKSADSSEIEGSEKCNRFSKTCRKIPKSILKYCWKSSAFHVAVFIIIFLCVNPYEVEHKFVDPRVIPEDRLISDWNPGLCGLIGAKHGRYAGRKCTGNTPIPHRQQFGCYLSECGRDECDERGVGWTVKEISSSGCRKPSETRKTCCRPLGHLCTWNGNWTHFPTLRTFSCQFIPDEKCGKVLCDKKLYPILPDRRNRCAFVKADRKLGVATCGKVDFEGRFESWYKKSDIFSVIDDI
ncbi:unnamed protein product [Caenorhabditis sp. 36 PRJEB53466]|nr:unnamed protein product [Caenorhabditis sp. 36 PRJEB53466]